MVNGLTNGLDNAHDGRKMIQDGLTNGLGMVITPKSVPEISLRDKVQDTLWCDDRQQSHTHNPPGRSHISGHRLHRGAVVLSTMGVHS